MTTDPKFLESLSDIVLITNDNISRYGFACFHQSGDRDINDGFWTREIEIGVGGEQGTIVQEFKVPQELCIELSHSKKIVASRKFEIKVSSTSAETIALLVQRAGWNQTMADLEAIQRYCQGGIFVAYYNYNNQQIPLGSGVSLPVSDDHCWIGMILVHAELRRQGIARAIMKACLEHAHRIQKKSVIGLDATPLGKQVYDSLGFKDSFTIWRCLISTNSKAHDFSGVQVESLDVEATKNYLLKNDYIERIQIIELLTNLPGSHNILARTSEVMEGFVLSRPGRLKPFVGPLIADSSEIALLLLQETLNYWKGLGHEDVFMDIPEGHLNESIFCREGKSANSIDPQIPVNPVRSFIRMYQMVKEKSNDMEGPKVSNTEITLKEAQHSHDSTAVFMDKENLSIVSIMFGTAGPEWS